MMVPMNSAVVTLRKDSPFPVRPDGSWSDQARWPALWICVPNPATPFVAAYKLEIDLTDPLDIELHVSGDERYRLFWNGEMIATGPEKGDEDHWPFDSIKCHFDAGHHTLLAQVWSLGDERAFAQHSVRPGFLLATTEYPDWFNTGSAPWVGKRLGGYRFRSPQVAWGTGFNVEMEGTNIDWGFELGLGTGWDAVETVNHATEVNYESEEGPCPLLVPARLPSRIYDPIPGYVVRHAELLPNGTSATSDLPILAANHDPNLSLEKVEASWPTPGLAIFGPKVMLANELSGSGGDMFPWLFKYHKIGPVIGTRTWGGLVRAFGFDLVDGGSINAPDVSFYNPHNGTWDVEGYGVAPDIDVEFDPYLWRQGKDAQLERAIAEINKGLATYKPLKLQRPPSANKKGKGSDGY